MCAKPLEVMSSPPLSNHKRDAAQREDLSSRARKRPGVRDEPAAAASAAARAHALHIMKPQELAFCSRSARVLLWKEWTKARILGLVFDNPPSLAPTSCSLDGWRPLESG